MTAQTAQAWPELRVQGWTATRDTLHMWTQIVGKIRLAHAPLVNHWWNVTLYVSARGLTTSAIPYGTRVFDIEFDFIDHQLCIRTDDGGIRQIALEPKSVADFYAQVMQALGELGIETQIQARPNEVDPAIPFAEDHTHASYDAEAAYQFWRQLVQADRVMNQFRAHFSGKVSPVHFFWGAIDLACTRFSGHTAPTHPGGAPNCGDWVMEEGYSHELSSCGFWPGAGTRARSTPTPIRNRTVSLTTPSAPPRRSTVRRTVSSCCPTRRCAPHRTPTRRCWSSCTPPTTPRPSAVVGTGPRWRTTRPGGTTTADPVPSAAAAR